MNPPLLQLSGVSKWFGALRALHDVSFDLHAGEVHALLGENGAGKSTFIRIITGAHQPDHGTISISGKIVEHLNPALTRRLGIACIYQQPALFPDLTVAENIGLRLETTSPWRRVNWTAQRERARQLLEKIGARISADSEVRELSMPEQQLVEIACAIGAGARIVIMDEPTASLTQSEQALLFGVIRELKSAGSGVIYISHRLDEISALADRVTVLRDGANAGTFSVVEDGLTEAALIRTMVGREISQLYPPAESKPGEVVLSLRNVGCRAGGIQNVNLDLRAGEIVGLAGLVGAGRTELARVLFGLTPADRGEIFLGDERLAIRSPGEAAERGIGCVPEDRRGHGVILEMAVASNVTMAIHPKIFPGGWLQPEAERAEALKWMANLQIKSGGPDAPVHSLSGGNQQKVSLARWLATNPRVLILDEPTQGVDVGAKSEIHKIIRRLAADGLAVLLISSDLSEVIGMSDRIGVMRGGKLVALLPGGSEAPAVMSAAMGQEGAQA